ncbi:MAG TPA: UvrD-helicase domain-containing protein [Candidatus Dormibacteraeota bacterium]|jgi:DNA helicase-2/ATP-dependent DNA helicase PcrA|nr:UvrD-helicase domain-containing protein [Candidatus Dormibacteraeota bacterium]
MNPAQKRAVEHRDGPLLVIAGAGTGKTRVITERIRHLLETDDSLSGENILGLTFTNKAAGEMKARVVKAAGERGKDVTLATFHAFCESLIADAAPDRLMLDQVDHWILLRRNMARLQLDKYRRLAEPGQFLSDFVEFFSRCQDELVSWEDYQRYGEELATQLESERAALDEDTYKERLDEVEKQLEIARAYRASEELLREKKRVSFGSLITGAVALLENNSTVRSTLQEKYRFILVDEFQDTNIAQLRLLELLAGDRKNIFAVGDNDQAIYRFRGASFGSFQLFLQRFAGWKSGEDSTPFRVSLTENYRSTPNILRVATQVIAQNTVSADFPKKSLNANRKEGEKIRIAELETEEAEATWVASELERIHSAGRKWRDFAVLYRQHAHRDKLVTELSRRKIPFVISRLSILEHPLVKDVIAYLRLIATPFDNIACARVIAAPAWHLEAPDLVRLAERAKKEKKPIYDLLQLPQAQLPFDPSPIAIKDLLDFLGAQRKLLKRRTAREILADLLEWLEVPLRATEQDRKYVNRLTEFAKAWEPKSETQKLTEFIEYLDYYSQAGGSICLEDDVPGDAVQLMTVHSAKGLEFPQVFVLRVNSKKFPASERPRTFEFPAALMKEGDPAEQFHVQEERRLFYVALTRAEERLTITTLIEKKGKVPLFIEDMLLDPTEKRRDIRQIAPKVPPHSETSRSNTDSEAQLFPVSQNLPRIFARIADWAETFHPPSAEPLSLSPSAINGYRSCPQQYLFSYLWSLREGPQAAMTFGAVMHNTIRRFVDQLRKGTRLPWDDLARIYEAEWKSGSFEDDYQEKGYKKDGLEQLRVFHAAVLENPPQVLEQEKGFELPVEDNVILTGRIDQINSAGGKKDVEIVDYKTGKPKKPADAKKDIQLSIYSLAAKEILELNPVRLVFHYLQNNERQETIRDAKQLDEAQKIVQEVASNIRAGSFPPKPGYLCRNCAYQPICPAHEENLSAQ